MHDNVRKFKRRMRASARAIVEKITSHIADPRQPRGTRYTFEALLEGIVSGLLHGYDDIASLTRFINESTVGRRLFSDGGPCRNTISLFMGKLSEQTQAIMQTLVKEETKNLQFLHIDGKTLRASHRRGGKSVHILNICNSQGITLHQVTVGEKTNEIPAAIEILKGLNLSGKVITADALLTQAEIARTIITNGGHYVFLVKANQSYLLAECDRQIRNRKVKIYKKVEIGHGRIEERKILVGEEASNLLAYFPGAKRAFKIISTRRIKGSDKIEEEIHYGITSLPLSEASAQCLLETRRNHWAIESKVHWRLDLTFNEDRCRIRNSKVASVLSLFRKIALNLYIEAGCLNIREGIQRFQMTT